tara:strand:+ start:219 stop:728 length:510 start_codon:yes stop_codon:yes gene_type:complete
MLGLSRRRTIDKRRGVKERTEQLPQNQLAECVECDDCAVCLETLDETDTMGTTQPFACTHALHSACAKRLFEKTTQDKIACPMCRCSGLSDNGRALLADTDGGKKKHRRAQARAVEDRLVELLRNRVILPDGNRPRISLMQSPVNMGDDILYAAMLVVRVPRFEMPPVS